MSHHDHHPKGILETCNYLTTTNHKDIGSLYLWLSLFNFFAAGAMALVMRAELFAPGQNLIEHNTYNQMVTMHGLVMIFGAIMPALAGFANWQLPLMIGAADIAFPSFGGVFGCYLLHLLFCSQLSF